MFLGTVRNISEVGKVREMTYEAYREMAEKELLRIEKEMMRKWPLKKGRIVHRTGRLALKDISVGIAVSSAHRADAFEACRYAIERIKRVAPIWKRERLSTGKDIWVEGHRLERGKR